jgi:serine/threonine-protein kinase
LAVASNGRYVYTAHRAEGVVSVLDTTSLQVSSTIPIDAAPPQYVAFSPGGSRSHVTAFDADYTVNVVVVVDTTTNAVV